MDGVTVVAATVESTVVGGASLIGASVLCLIWITIFCVSEWCRFY
nr:MAG TPA: hypothetical protein [Caudoviricetes sp.]